MCRASPVLLAAYCDCNKGYVCNMWIKINIKSKLDKRGIKSDLPCKGKSEIITQPQQEF